MPGEVLVKTGAAVVHEHEGNAAEAELISEARHEVANLPTPDLAPDGESDEIQKPPCYCLVHVVHLQTHAAGLQGSSLVTGEIAGQPHARVAHKCAELHSDAHLLLASSLQRSLDELGLVHAGHFEPLPNTLRVCVHGRQQLLRLHLPVDVGVGGDLRAKLRNLAVALHRGKAALGPARGRGCQRVGLLQLLARQQRRRHQLAPEHAVLEEPGVPRLDARGQKAEPQQLECLVLEEALRPAPVQLCGGLGEEQGVCKSRRRDPGTEDTHGLGRARCLPESPAEAAGRFRKKAVDTVA
mmetsp:Transcript_41961/g.94683  ORF Transcript_41961/g.94683 Transcript_41961/m.94683 type:complete len:297 (+) Transcript_41961:210-1100(+)